MVANASSFSKLVKLLQGISMTNQFHNLFLLRFFFFTCVSLTNYLISKLPLCIYFNLFDINSVINYLESSLMVTVPEETKNLAASPLSSITVTTPGARTANAGTWSGKIPKDPENDGTSTCLTLASL